MRLDVLSYRDESTDALTVRLSSAEDLWAVDSASPDDPRLMDIVRT